MEPTHASAPELDPPEIGSEIGASANALRQLLGETLALLGLEAQQAASSLAGMLVLGIVAAVMALGAWLLAQAAVAVALTLLGAELALVLLSLALLNALASIWLWRAIRRLSRNLRFCAVRQAWFDPAS